MAGCRGTFDSRDDILPGAPEPRRRSPDILGARAPRPRMLPRRLRGFWGQTADAEPLVWRLGVRWREVR